MNKKSLSNIINWISGDIAIDLGTANTLIWLKGQGVVINEPSIVARTIHDDNIVAVGDEAKAMLGRTHRDLETIRPLQDGVIADFKMTDGMLQGFINKINFSRMARPRMVICVPSGVTEVERRAVKDSGERANAREVYLIEEPVAAAIGIGLDISQPIGNIIVDIGGGTTEIAVIALSGIVCDQSIRVAGDSFNKDILDYMRRQHNLLIGERTAERVKIEVGSALTELDDGPEDYEIRGRDLMTGIPKVIKISYSEIAFAIDKSVSKIEEAVLKALEISPPELSADIYDNGIYLTGGGALLRGLDKRLSMKTKLPIHIAEDPLACVAVGTGKALEQEEIFSTVLSEY